METTNHKKDAYFLLCNLLINITLSLYDWADYFKKTPLNYYFSATNRISYNASTIRWFNYFKIDMFFYNILFVNFT